MKYLFLISIFFYSNILLCQIGMTKECVAQFDSISNRTIYRLVDSMPEFPGGIDSLFAFINNNLTYPAGDFDFEARVYVAFIVEPDGSISNKCIIRGSEELINTEALRLIDKMPKWKPGKCNDIAVPVRYIIPIRFKLY